MTSFETVEIDPEGDEPSCQVPACPNFGDPDFGELDCPPSHASPPDGPFRDNKLYVLDRKCDTCIFRPGNLMHLRDGARDKMVAECIEQNSQIPCHETLDGPRSVCRGYWDLHKRDVPVLRMAVAFGMVAFDPPPLPED